MKNPTKSLFIAAAVGTLTALVLIIGIFAGGVLLGPSINANAQTDVSPPPVEVAQTQSQPAIDENDLVAAYEQALIDVYQETLPSVVNIRVTHKVDGRFLERFGFGPPQTPDEEEPGVVPNPDAVPETEPEVPPEFFNQGGGTGFVWDSEGHIITNYHVVADATDIEVTFADDTTVKAELVGSDPDSDLAIVKVDVPAGQLKPVVLGDSDTLEVGQLAIAIGNPFGQDFTMTSGIISGVGRTIRGGNSGFSIPEVIQTDAPINPGNSGGPLLNRHGEVLGINSQIISRSGSNSGVGFAVPVNTAKRVVPVLIQGETYEYAWLGISGGAVTSEVIEARNLPADTKGTLVSGVVEEGPAHAAGLQGRDETLDPEEDAFRFSGEIITAINGQPVGGIDDLITYLLTTSPGDTVTLDIIQDDGQVAQIEVTLGVRPTIGMAAVEDE